MEVQNNQNHREGNQSPRYSSERRSERMSRSPGPRKNSGGYGDMEPEDRRYRRRGSRSNSPRDGSSPRRMRSPRSPRDNYRQPRRRGSGSHERGGERDLGPYTNVYVTNFPRAARREDLEAHFARDGAEIRNIVMKINSKYAYAFIEFKRPEDAAMAVKDLDKTEFDGRELTV